MKKRFLAMLLCLSVLLMACACAAETMEPPAVSETESKAPAPQFTLSEVNAESSTTQEPAAPSETAPAESEPQETISIEESDIELEPIQPVEPIQPIEPIKPEEKETTLEKVLSFDIGIDGMMEYSFLFYDDPSVADIGIYGNAYTDGNGVFYQVDYNDIIRVNDGAKFPFVSWSQVFDIKICQNNFYVLRAGPTGLYSILYHYDISTGFETPTLKTTYDNLPSGYLGLMGEMPVVLEQGKVYGVDGKLLNESNTPFIVEQSKNDSLTVQMQNNVLTIQQGDSYNCYVTALSASGTIVAETKKKANGTIYTSYDRDGNVIARFFHDTHYGLSLPCNLDFRGGSDEILTVKTYRPFGATIGDQVFEKLVDGRVFFDVYGNAYYAAYYLDHCDIYTIDQGYSDVQLPVDEELQAGDSSVAPTSNASGSSASDIWYLSIDSDEVQANAENMITLEWYVREGNLTRRFKDDNSGIELELPNFLKNAAIGSQQFGIPYCGGGNNGDDNFESETRRLLDDGSRQMAGNITEVTHHQPDTIGLDCMRFVGKALELTDEDGLAPWEFIKYYLQEGLGHRVYSVSELDEMDIIISSKHAMFYWKTENGLVWVYDTTAGGDSKTSGRMTIFTESSLVDYRDPDTPTVRYKFYHIYSDSGYDATQHWTGCASCDDYNVYEPHTMELSETGHFQKCTGCDYMVLLTPHTFEYTYSTTLHSGTCSVCGYTEGGAHSMTTSGDADGHVHSCICGYSIPGEHNFTYTTYNLVKHRQTCSTCGYSALAPHLLGYSYDADGHWQECSLCSFKTVSLAHNFVGSECTVCGCPQHMIMDIIAIPEEDELLPVPEDQKATL